jgi:hypothetical protein
MLLATGGSGVRETRARQCEALASLREAPVPGNRADVSRMHGELDRRGARSATFGRVSGMRTEGADGSHGRVAA